MDGMLIVNKPENCTSRDVVNMVGKILNVKRIGHTGTLDPLAKGVLVLCIGKATKMVEMLTGDEKEYIASVTLGIKTDTLDCTGSVVEKRNVDLTQEQIVNVLNSMVGTYNQEVPIYSAVKINGKKLYEYARKNISIELPKRSVNIKRIQLLDEIKYLDGKIIFKFKCLVSKGTYIRSLVNDIAEKLGTIGMMSDLIRIKQGKFSIENSYKIEEIKTGNFKIINMLNCLDGYLIIDVDDYLSSKIKNGAILQNRYDKNVVAFKYKNNLLAIYKVYEKDSSKIKPWKIF